MPDVDLNLLTVLDALLQEGSVTAAARRLNLTPPAVSRSLKRLRQVTGDPLLVRMGRSLVPTPTAELLRDRAHSLLADVHEILAPRTHVADSEIERTIDQTFTVQAASDTAELFGPALVEVIHSRTKKARLTLIDDGPSHRDTLSSDRIDLYIGTPLPLEERDIIRERLLTDQMVLVGRRDGILSRTAPGMPPSARDIAAVPHVAATRRGDVDSALDAYLEDHLLAREVVVSTPGYTSAFTMLRNSDFLCLAPAGLTRDMLGADLVAHPLPALVPPVFIEMAWHRRTHSATFHRWFRDRVREAALSTCPDERRRAQHRAEHALMRPA